MVREPRRLAVREIEDGDADRRLAKARVVRLEPVDRTIEEGLELRGRADGREPVGGRRRRSVGRPGEPGQEKGQ
jgi:hypothetical protein